MTRKEGSERIHFVRATLTNRQKLLVALACGSASGLALPPFDLWYIALLGLAVSFRLFLACKTAKQAALVGWGLGTGYFAICLHWIVEPFAIDAARHLWMAPFAIVFMSTGLALFWSVAFWVAHLLAQPHRIWASGLAWASCFCTAEMLRSLVFTGFPWALVSQIWIETDLVLWISVLGPHGLTFATLLASAFAAISISQKNLIWRIAYVVPLLALATGFFVSPKTRPVSALNSPVVRLVQPNAPQHQKWDPEKIPFFFQRQLEFTAAPSEDGIRPDLIVWPEMSLATVLKHSGETFQTVSNAAQGSPVVVGLRRLQGNRIFNSLVLLDKSGSVAGIYDKHHLVPFGEYVPLGQALARFGINGLAASDGAGFSAGPGPRVLDFGKLGKALPLICYEAIFPNDINGVSERPRFLLQITNDAWFGQFSGPYQHLAQARMRSIEQGLPMVRVANTGVSAMIDARGRVMTSLKLGVAGFVDASLPPSFEPTLYSRIGDLPIILVIALCLSALGSARALGQRKIH